MSQPLPPFEVLVTCHGAAVLRVCRALVGVQEADDVWQETFLAALRVYPSCNNVRNWEAWLVTIARNKAMDHHRKAGRLPIPASDGAPHGFTGSPAGVAGGGRLGHESAGARSAGDFRGAELGNGSGDVVARSVEAGQDADLVWAALAKLPPKQREAVVYHHLAGLAYADVAGLLGNSEPAARRAAADGMKSLRTHLAQDREDQW